ncbi:uncharacterized protein [Typha latifolia]|uniref:uncharacterized protein isoform X1 n=1 Tax=Typha latifolia TaxID=4733 RepID=UPI003C2C692A
MKLSAPSDSNSIEELSPKVANSSAKEQSTDDLSQATPSMNSTYIPSPRSEEDIVEALKGSNILVPKRVQQERWNKELFLRIPRLARVISKTKLMRLFKRSSAVEGAKKHTQESASTASSEEDESSTVSGTPPEALASEVCSTDRDQENTTIADEGTESEATRRHTEELIYVASIEAAMQIIVAEMESPSLDISNMQNPTPPKKIILTCKMKLSPSETEKRRLRRKWNYIKVIISDVQEALREKPTSIETTEIIEDSLEELQQLGQDIEASVEEIVPILKKLAAEIKLQNSLDKRDTKKSNIITIVY